MKFHVLLTTYEMVGSETTTLRGLEYETLIVDEGHRYGSNHALPASLCSARHQSAITIKPKLSAASTGQTAC